MVLQEEITYVDVDKIGGACSCDGADDGGQDVLKQLGRVDAQPEKATHHVRRDRDDRGTGTSQVPGDGPVPASEIGGPKQKGLRAALVLVLDGLKRGSRDNGGARGDFVAPPPRAPPLVMCSIPSFLTI